MKLKISLVTGIFIVFIIGFLVRLFNVIRFPVLPIAFDPWFHISITNSILNDGLISLGVYRANLLFHFLSVIIKLITGLDVFIIAKYIPIVLGSLSLFCFYFLFKKITNNGKIILFSLLFLASVNFSFIFATNQFWPELIALPLLGLTLGFFIDLLMNKSKIKNIVLVLFTFFTIILIHDLSSLMTLISLSFIFIFFTIYHRKINYYSFIVLFFNMIFVFIWGFMFTTDIILLQIVSSIYFILIPLFVVFSIAFYIFYRIKKYGNLNKILVSKLSYYFWVISTIFGTILFFLIFLLVPPLNNAITFTSEYLFFVIPMESILVCFISLGILIIFENFNKESSLIVGLIGGPAVLLPFPIVLTMFSLPIIEADRILTFAFIGGSLIIAIAISFLFTKIFESKSENKRKIEAIILIASISFVIIPGVLWSFPSPSGGLKYINWNTETEYNLAIWAKAHIDQQQIISDWRVGYILRGFLMDIPNGYDIKIDPVLLYWNNYPYVESLPKDLGIYLVIDDWMVLNGPTQPFSYGIRPPLMESKMIYDQNSTYVKIYDNGYEWIYFL